MPGRKTLGDAGKVKSLLEAVQKYKNFKQMAQFNVVSLKARADRRELAVGHDRDPVGEHVGFLHRVRGEHDACRGFAEH